MTVDKLKKLTREEQLELYGAFHLARSTVPFASAMFRQYNKHLHQLQEIFGHTDAQYQEIIGRCAARHEAVENLLSTLMQEVA